MGQYGSGIMRSSYLWPGGQVTFPSICQEGQQEWTLQKAAVVWEVPQREGRKYWTVWHTGLCFLQVWIFFKTLPDSLGKIIKS